MTIAVDTMWESGRRVEARVVSSSTWKQRRNGDYVVDLLAGDWYCTCWPYAKSWPCRHAKRVAAHLGMG